MSDPALSGAICVVLSCTPVLAQDPARGCILLNPVQPNTLYAQDLAFNDLCSQDGKVISIVNVDNSRSWEGKIVPPYNRVRMSSKGETTETQVTFRTPSATYQVRIKP